MMGKTIFNVSKVPHDPGHLIIAFLGHLGFGAILAIALSIIYLKTGINFHYIKGGFYGLLVWLFIRSAFISAGMPEEPKSLNVITAAVSLTSHVVYGLVLAYLIVKFNKFIPRVPHSPKPQR